MNGRERERERVGVREREREREGLNGRERERDIRRKKAEYEREKGEALSVRECEEGKITDSTEGEI